MVWGIAMMIAIIVATDQLIWRPVIAWADKFKFEQVESTKQPRSPILYALRNSNAIGWLHSRTVVPFGERIYHSLAARRLRRLEQPERTAASRQRSLIANSTIFITLLIAATFAAVHAILLLRQVHGAEILELLKGAGATFLRVNVSLLISALWTIPVGVAIGFHPKLARIAQPLAQIAASVPATALFPVILIALVRAGGGLGVGSIALMLLGTQWYILFNVIAGAIAIPTDLKEVSGLYRFTDVQRWTTLILPGIFPYLITGLVTASGGAWNASIVAEYFHLRGETLSTLGLGAEISRATDHGQFATLLMATIIMALMVVTINRLVWRPLFQLAETKYRLEG
jgi:NitT/TauT family transport system permease protein